MKQRILLTLFVLLLFAVPSFAAEVVHLTENCILKSDVVESETAAADTFTVTATPLAEGDTVHYNADTDTECGTAAHTQYSICAMADADTVKLDETIGCGGDCSTCASALDITSCTPPGS